ncbi:MAG: type II toxin-antitoxin system HicB family antitoxin [Synergistaceae bacterium]|nr:type II toxin-antitoxin system HicB family antitoxin [Synergistaceae bacterium]
MKFTACYTKLEDGFGYMGQLLEWPGVITDGKDLEECEEMLKDAAREMALAYLEDGRKIPHEELIVKPIDIPLDKGELFAQLEREGLLARVV